MPSRHGFTFGALLLVTLALTAAGSPSFARVSAAHRKPVHTVARPHRATTRKAPSKSKKKPSVKKAGGKSHASSQRARPSASAARGRPRRAAPIIANRPRHKDEASRTLTPPPAYTAPPPTGPAPAFTVSPAAVPATDLPAEIQFAEHLDRFFVRLQAVETGDNQQTVRVLQFGDAHTATDMFTARMRLLLQQKFGDGGAGFTYAGQPFTGYRVLGTTRAQSGRWIEEGLNSLKIVNSKLGLGGVASTSTRTGDSISLDAPCSSLQVQYLDQPGGGDFSVTEDGRALTHISTDGALAPQTYESACTASSGNRDVHHFELVADSARPVRLFGTVTERPGITYEALGLNGAAAALMLRWDRATFTSYLKQRDPALIVLAYGTSEASNHTWTYESYGALMGRLIDMVHATAPDAAILVIGPPDRSVPTERRRSRHRKPPAGNVNIGDTQRDVCRTHGCAFWDWRTRMGGPGSMSRWVDDGLAQPDHTSFTSTGYIQLANFFYSDLIAAYGVWKGPHPDVPLVIRASPPLP